MGNIGSLYTEAARAAMRSKAWQQPRRGIGTLPALRQGSSPCNGNQPSRGGHGTFRCAQTLTPPCRLRYYRGSFARCRNQPEVRAQLS